MTAVVAVKPVSSSHSPAPEKARPTGAGEAFAGVLAVMGEAQQVPEPPAEPSRAPGAAAAAAPAGEPPRPAETSSSGQPDGLTGHSIEGAGRAAEDLEGALGGRANRQGVAEEGAPGEANAGGRAPSGQAPGGGAPNDGPSLLKTARLGPSGAAADGLTGAPLGTRASALAATWTARLGGAGGATSSPEASVTVTRVLARSAAPGGAPLEAGTFAGRLSTESDGESVFARGVSAPALFEAKTTPLSAAGSDNQDAFVRSVSLSTGIYTSAEELGAQLEATGPSPSVAGEVGNVAGEPGAEADEVLTAVATAGQQASEARNAGVTVADAASDKAARQAAMPAGLTATAGWHAEVPNSPGNAGAGGPGTATSSASSAPAAPSASQMPSAVLEGAHLAARTAASQTELASAGDAGPEPLATQLASVLAPASHQADGSYQVNIRLQPEDLGAVHVELHLEAGTVNVSLHADEESTRDMLRQNLGQLREQLTGTGLSTGRFDVSGGPGSGAGSGFFGRAQSPQPLPAPLEGTSDDAGTSDGAAPLPQTTNGQLDVRL